MVFWGQASRVNHYLQALDSCLGAAGGAQVLGRNKGHCTKEATGAESHENLILSSVSTCLPMSSY